MEKNKALNEELLKKVNGGTGITEEETEDVLELIEGNEYLYDNGAGPRSTWETVVYVRTEGAFAYVLFKDRNMDIKDRYGNPIYSSQYDWVLARDLYPKE